MEKLPSEVLVHIFSFLEVEDKCRVAGVCKSWRELVDEKRYWKNVNFFPFRVDLSTLWRALRRNFTDSLLTLHLRGFVYTSNKTARCLTNAILKDICQRCPNIVELHIDEADLSGVDSGNLPPTLKVLALHRCITTPGWFYAGVARGRLDRLRTLNLRRSKNICDEDLEDLTFLPKGGNLKRLKIAYCHSVTRRGFRSLAKLITLEELDISGTNIEDQEFKSICKNLREELSIFNFAECDLLTDESADSLLYLRRLNMSYTGAKVEIRRPALTLTYLYYRRRIHMGLFRSYRCLRRWSLNLITVYLYLGDYTF